MARQYTYDSETIREELDDRIYVVSPLDIPLQTLFAHETIGGSTTFEWPVDDIDNPTAVNAQQEGATPTATSTVRSRLQNIVMIDHMGIDITDTQRVSNEAGVRDEFAYQIVKKGLELLKRIDFNLHWSQYVAGGYTTARRTEGLISWLALAGTARTSSESMSCGGRPVHPKYGGIFHAPSSAKDITEAILRDSLLGPAWDIGMDIPHSILLCGQYIKTEISDFGVVYGGTAGASNTVSAAWINAESKKKVLTIDIFESDFGPLAVALDRWMNLSGFGIEVTQAGTTVETGLLPRSIGGNNSLVIVEDAYFCVANYRPPFYSPLAKTADATLGYVGAEYGLKVKNPKAGILGTELVDEARLD